MFGNALNLKSNRTESKKERIQRQKASLKSMHFNRYLFIRYFLATFVFANFAWTVLSWGDPIGYYALFLLVMALLPVWEMGKMYGVRNPSHMWTRFYFAAQFCTTAAMCVVIWTAPVSFLFPFLTESTASRTVGFAISLLGLVMSFLVLRRLHKIEHGTDKQYQRIQYFETKYKIHI